jgi:hypothetical protein
MISIEDSLRNSKFEFPAYAVSYEFDTIWRLANRLLATVLGSDIGAGRPFLTLYRLPQQRSASQHRSQPIEQKSLAASMENASLGYGVLLPSVQKCKRSAVHSAIANFRPSFAQGRLSRYWNCTPSICAESGDIGCLTL